MNDSKQPLLRPNEFACLQHQGTSLYTEIIQVVTKGDRYWARPVLLCESETPIADFSEDLPTIYDVRSCSDLLWPRSLFRSVFDTELIPLLAHLQPDPIIPLELPEQWTGHLKVARQKLHQFTQQLWNADPKVFQD
jgi:hypothetical protein